MRLTRLPSVKILFVLTYGGRYTHVTSPGWLVRDRFQILAQVERVSGSHALRESESLRKLLNYLTHQALDHPGEPIKEYQIATEVLGRQSDFDPQFNSMVRVQAGRLRSKLTEYYSDEGSDDPIVVDFPKGTYALHFRERKSALPKSPGTEEHGSNGHALSSVAPTRTASLWNALTIGLLIALFACLSCLGYLLTRKPIDAPSSSAEKLPESVEIFWQGFLTEPEEPWVIFSNAEFVGRPETGMRYYVEGKDSKEAVRDHYTGVGEVLGIHNLDLVFAMLHRKLRVKRGKLFSLDDAQKNDLIIVGSPSENLTLLEIPSTKLFSFRRVTEGPRKGDLGIANLQPANGESTMFLASPAKAQLTEDYAIVAMIPGTNPAHSELILAGTTTIGTQAAVEFVTEPNHLEALLNSLGVKLKDQLKPFEAVLHVRVARGVPVESTIVGLRSRK